MYTQSWQIESWESRTTFNIILTKRVDFETRTSYGSDPIRLTKGLRGALGVFNSKIRFSRGRLNTYGTSLVWSIFEISEVISHSI